MDNNSGWHNYSEGKPPDGSKALVYLEKPHLGSRFAIWSSRKSASGYLVVINDHFYYDFSGKILAWKLLDEIEDTVPLIFTETTNA